MASKQARSTGTQKAPKLQWVADQAAIDKLRDAGQFIHVGGSRAKTSRLTGALQNKWQADEPEAIFNTTYRISGPNMQAVYNALIAAGYDEATANEIVANSVSYQNYQTTKKGEYDAEFAHRKSMPKSKKEQSEPEYSVENILWFAQELKEKGHVQAEQSVNKGKKAVSQPGKAHSGVSLAEKVRNLQAGKVLDVSNMDLVSEYGHGARTIKAPGQKSGKLGIAALAGLVSNDINTYRRAVELAYGSEVLAQYARELGQLEASLKGKVPVPVPVVASAVVPGQTLAPPVILQAVPATSSAGKPQVTLPPKVLTPKVGTIGGTVPQLPALSSFRK